MYLFVGLVEFRQQEYGNLNFNNFSKIESQPAPVKIVKTIPKTEDAEKVESTIEEIKKAHNFQTCAY